RAPRQRFAIRARRLAVDAGSGARGARGRRDRSGLGLRERRREVGPTAAVRRDQGLRLRARAVRVRHPRVREREVGLDGVAAAMTTGAELLVRCLEREGVRYVFGVPGEETLDVNDALARSSIQFVAVRHEQGAAFMADVWGRLTGRARVCLATLGPGATNLVTGVADANLDRAPVVAITGQLPRHLLHKESHQYVDIVDVFRPLT